MSPRMLELLRRLTQDDDVDREDDLALPFRPLLSLKSYSSLILKLFLKSFLIFIVLFVSTFLHQTLFIQQCFLLPTPFDFRDELFFETLNKTKTSIKNSLKNQAF